MGVNDRSSSIAGGGVDLEIHIGHELYMYQWTFPKTYSWRILQDLDNKTPGRMRKRHSEEMPRRLKGEYANQYFCDVTLIRPETIS